MKRKSGKKISKGGNKSLWRELLYLVGIAIIAALIVGGIMKIVSYFSDSSTSQADDGTILTTGYCNCGQCCGWEKNKKGEIVYNYGKLKGKKKVVGRTSTGTTAKHGTIAADPSVFPMGTKLEIPGYGVGKVEDVGGAIKGNHIDLWFPTHEEAKKWGRRRVKVKVIK